MHLALHLARPSTSLDAPAQPSALLPFLDQRLLDTHLDTKELGANVGRKWGLEKIMRWRETVRCFLSKFEFVRSGGDETDRVFWLVWCDGNREGEMENQQGCIKREERLWNL